MKRWLLAGVLAFLSSVSPAGTVSGIINKPNGQPVTNGTISFGLSQAGATVGTATFVTTDTAYCGTDPSGNVVGITAPLVPAVLSANYIAGTLPGSQTYYVQFTYTGDSGETTAGPETSFLMVSNGTLNVGGPLLHPSGATGYNVYAGTTPGSETLQFAVPNFTSSAITSPIIPGGGPPVPGSNSTLCSLTFNDAIIPANTTYSVNLITSDGKQVGGFPQRFYLAGAAVDISQLTPAGNIFAKFPTAIIAQPSGNGVQSIAGPLSLGAYDLIAHSLHITGPLALAPYNLGNVLHVGDSVVAPWSGLDIGAQINAAYALAVIGNTIVVDPPAGGGCYSFATPIIMNTAGKVVGLEGSAAVGGTTSPSGGSCLNYTPTSGSAITLDYVSTLQSPFTSKHGIKNLTLINNLCTTSGGCGGTAVGVDTGTTNAGSNGATFEGLSVWGFSTAHRNLNPLSVNQTWINFQAFCNGTVIRFKTPTSFTFIGGTMAGNGPVFVANDTASSGEIMASNLTFFANSGLVFDATAVVGSPAYFYCTACHFENSSLLPAKFISGNVNFFLSGGLMEDDNAVGTESQFISASGNNFMIDGVSFSSARTVTQIVLANSPVRGILRGYDATGGGHFTNYIGGTNAAFVTQEMLSGPSTSASKPFKYESQVQFGAGIVADGGGFKQKRVASPLGGTCPTGGAAGNACTSANISWTTPFVDNNYTLTCTLNNPTNQPHMVGTTKLAAGAGFTITIATDLASAANAGADCIAVHD